MKYKLCIMFCLILAACSKEDDDFSVNTENDDTFNAYVSKTQILTHTKGNGVPIVIMADGYTQSDISNGTYQDAIDKATAALFASEPMASLKDYFDVYSVVVRSDVSGITTSKRATAFATHFKSTSEVEVYGDSILVMDYAQRALQGTGHSLRYCLTIVLLNSQQYGGVTLITEPPATTDSIPQGFSLSYVPVGCKYAGKSYFNLVLQHEAVGHGIGKLHDEYFQQYDAPEKKYITQLQNRQQSGYYLNVEYNAEADDEPSYGTSLSYLGRVMKIIIGAHEMQPGSIGYFFSSDNNYSSEKLKWYQGGATYLTIGDLYSGSNPLLFGYYTAEKNFYRPTVESMMNGVMSSNSLKFNAISRYIIYSAVMKTAGAISSTNLHSPDLVEKFKSFDIPALSTQSSASAKASATPSYSGSSTTTPPALPEPKIIPYFQ